MSASTRQVKRLAVTAVAVFALDHAAKLAVSGFGWTSLQNDVADAWSTRLLWLLFVVAVALAGILGSRTAAVAAGLYVGGVLANAVDTAFWPGGVVDFVPTFAGVYANLADASIGLGLTLVLVGQLAGSRTAAVAAAVYLCGVLVNAVGAPHWAGSVLGSGPTASVYANLAYASIAFGLSLLVVRRCRRLSFELRRKIAGLEAR